MTRFFIHTRVSTDKQKVENQYLECKHLVDSLWEEGDELFEFSEPETSSRKSIANRPILKEMLEAIMPGDVLVIYKLDRLAREGQELINIYCDLVDKGVTIHSIYEPTADKSYVHIIAFVAMIERENIRLRTISGLNRKRANMERVGTAWYGYKLDENKLSKCEGAKSKGKPYLLIPDENEQAAIQLMLNAASHGFSYQKIVDELTAKGYMNREGNPFHKSSVRRILLRQKKPDLIPTE